MKKIALIIAVIALSVGQSSAQNKNSNKMNTEEHYIFELSDKVTGTAVTFKNRYGIILSGDLYLQRTVWSS